MSAFAAVMTDKGTGAISTIQLFGGSAEAIMNEVFRPVGSKPVKFETGQILLGVIHDGTKTIDQVTVGCEAPKSFAISCHGNPLIVEMIMQLLQRCGAELVSAEKLLVKTLKAQKGVNAIAIEARLAQIKAKTLEGAKIIANQVTAGLTMKATGWLRQMNDKAFEAIKTEAEKILADSAPAKLIIAGCQVAIVGPPNSGKSTLLNRLSGWQKAIVTDIKGTTRDWVSAQCQIPPLAVELIDTAGLDEQLAATPKRTVERASQRKSLQVIKRADVVLLVLDSSRPAEQLGSRLVEKIARKKVVTVLNKRDLPCAFDTNKLPTRLTHIVQISAKFGTAMEALTKTIRQVCGVADFDLKTPVCFTSRQEKLLRQLTLAKSSRRAASIITELLDAPVRV
jgi:tRNA modification GTPase